MAAWYVKNVPAWERVLRVVMGVGGAGGALYFLSGVVAWVLAASILGFAVTGLLGFCPMCAMLGRKLH